MPVSLNGERLGLVELLEKAAEIGCRHGVGIVDHIEDRIVGLKVRDIYEVPAAAIVLTAHEELERLVGTIHQNQFKPALDQKWGYLVYAGLWWEPLRTDLDAYMDAVNAQVTRRDRPAPLQRQRPRRHPLLAQRRLRRRAGDLLRVRRSLRPERLAGLHRALVAAVADGAPDPRAGRGLMYNRLGKASIKFAFRYLRRRYRRESQIALGLLAAAVAVAAYLATRERPRGLRRRARKFACGLSATCRDFEVGSLASAGRAAARIPKRSLWDLRRGAALRAARGPRCRRCGWPARPSPIGSKRSWRRPGTRRARCRRSCKRPRRNSPAPKPKRRKPRPKRKNSPGCWPKARERAAELARKLKATKRQLAIEKARLRRSRQRSGRPAGGDLRERHSQHRQPRPRLRRLRELRHPDRLPAGDLRGRQRSCRSRRRSARRRP